MLKVVHMATIALWIISSMMHVGPKYVNVFSLFLIENIYM
jgi:hypothetical protein